jgi:biopolymer transport protein ExbB
MRHKKIVIMVVAGTVFAAQVSAAEAQADMAPNGNGYSVPAAQPSAPIAAPAANAPAAAPAPSAAAPQSPATDAGPAPSEHFVSTAELPQDLSPWGMFLHADIIVKAVMIGLALASLVTWTVWIAKTLELRSAGVAARRGLRLLAQCVTLSQAYDLLRGGSGPIAQLLNATAAEIRVSANLRGDGLKERIAWQLERIEMAASRKVSRGTGILATIGSTAPFVGLFGTVWGIMDSFIGISKAHTTNLAVVAPGIAEALLATALGLVAAIPAVMIYNVLARSTAHYRALLGDASAQVMKLVSRDLDRAKLPLSQAAE